MSFALYLTAAFTVVLTGMTVQAKIDHAEAFEETETKAIVGNMLIYRKYVNQYATANISEIGSVSTTSLNLPAWFNLNSNLRNYVETGKGYVYMQTPKSDYAYRVLKYTNSQVKAGIKINGNLANPLSTTNTSSPIPLPSAIPDGSVVLIP